MNGNRDGTSANSSLLHRALEERNRQQMLDVLGDPIRRQVLHDLDPDEGRVALSDLAERVANRLVRSGSGVAFRSNDGTDAGDPTAATDRNSSARTPADADPIDRVALRLHHVHLPKLADYGLVEYDHRERTVRATTDS